MATLSMQQMAQQMAAMQAALDKMAAENAALKAAPMAKLTLKVSEKGAVSVYGLGRFPVTLYGEQWTRLLDKAAEIKAFMDANRDKLATKDGAVAAAAVNAGKATF